MSQETTTYLPELNRPLIDLGYMAKLPAPVPPPLAASGVTEVAAVSGCISPYFCDYIPHWQHNAYWLFDRPETLLVLAQSLDIAVADLKLYFYRAYPLQCENNGSRWRPFHHCAELPYQVEAPQASQQLGFDVVSHAAENAPECSYLSCNLMCCKLMAQANTVNCYALFTELATAIKHLCDGSFSHCEPGPSCIIAVYRVLYPGFCTASAE